MVRLMFVMPQFPGFGGIETVSASLMEYLGNDMEIYVFAMRSVSGMSEPECIKGVFIASEKKIRRIAEEYNDAVRKSGITHVISQGGFSMLTKIVLNNKRDRDVKVITALHGMPKYETIEFEGLQKVRDARNRVRFKWKLYWSLGIGAKVLEMKRRGYLRLFSDSFRTACSKGDKMVLLSQGYISEFISFYGLEKWRDKVTAISNPCPVKYSSEVPLPVQDRADDVLYVGRLSNEKGIDLLLDAWKMIGDRDGWKFRIVGEGPARPHLEAIVREEKIDNVVFEGYASEPERFYRTAKICLLASGFEGFGMCLLEAARFGVVPVSFDISAGVRDVVDGSGVLVPGERDAGAMADAVGRLMADSALWEKMSCDAFRHSEKFSLGKIGEQWKRLIMSL